VSFCICFYFTNLQNLIGKSVDLSEEIKLFLAVLESRRNRHDEDVKWAITAMKKTKVAELMGIDTTN
jgi:hypothetical protein